tara:strand:- start:43 stop:450 length:408 start_codon:yes stop_codon:yes gene_type:complete
MKKAILLLAMLCSMAMFSQRPSEKIKVDFELEKQKFTGLWVDLEKNNYYTAIMYNKKQGFKFVNFSFIENQTVKEDVLTVEKFFDKIIIKTKLTNPKRKKWEVYCEYLVMDDYTIEVIYSGDYNATHNLSRKYIH